MVKYHIDSYEGFQETMDNRTWRKIIVRIHNERALIMFGHDKCNFKQYLLTIQRIGYGMILMDEQAQTMNAFRKSQTYIVEEAATKYLSGSQKGKSPVTHLLVILSMVLEMEGIGM